MKDFQIKMINEFENTEKLVRIILEDQKRARNDDEYLISVVKMYNPKAKSETVTRCRRKIQNTQGELLPTDPEVLVKRRIREEIIKNFYSRNNPVLIKEWELRRYQVK